MNNSPAKTSGCVCHRGDPRGGLLRVFCHLLICMAGVFGVYHASAQEGQATPSAPQHFEPMPGDHAVTLVWTPPLNDGGSEVTGYEYRMDGGDWMTAGDGTARRVTISDLNNGQLYQFEVRALNAMGAGDVAGPVTALPLGPQIEISITADTDSVEEGSPAVFTLERIFNPLGNPDKGVATTVAISVMVSTAEAEHPQGTNSTKIVTDPPIPMQIEFDAGQQYATLSIPTEDDSLDEYDSVVTVMLTDDNAPGYRLPDPASGRMVSASVTVMDEDPPPNVSITGGSAPEMAGEITFAISLDTASGLPVTVDWSTGVAATPSQGTDMATADGDYESASGTLNFPAGETEMTFRVMLIDDELDEHREEFVVTLGNPMNAVLGTETATGAIEDDDEPPTISIAGAGGGESDGPLMFAVSLDAPSGLPVTVDWSTDVAATPSQGSDMATADGDYESASGTLNFPAGETEMMIPVKLVDDELDEHREEFVVTLGNPMYAVLGTEAATGAIEDDDEPPTISIAGAGGGESDGPLMFAVSLDAPSGLPVTVDWSTDVAATPSQGTDMATADGDYESASGTLNFPAGETEMMIPVKLVDDELDEHREEFVVTLGNPMYAVLGTETATGAIEDDDEPPTISIAGAGGGESDGPLMFAVSLDAPSGLPVTVDWSTDVAATPSQGSDMATADGDYESASGTLNFPAGETEMMIPVKLVDDELDEHREEFVVTLGNPMYAVLGTEAATGAIEDDDEPPTISIAGAGGGESDGPLMFAVSLDAPSGLPVTVDWSTDVAATPSQGSDMATADGDYESASGTLNFPAGETEMTIRVVLIDDQLVELPEEFVVTLGNPMYAVLGTETATGAIEDDDKAPTISIAGGSATEMAGAIIFAVSLDTASALPVTVDWSTDVAATPTEGSDMATPDEDYESASGTLNFPAGETKMTIRVVLIEDEFDDERLEEFVVTLSNPMNAVLGTETATGVIGFVDRPPTISIADASGGESDGPLMFAVSLDVSSGLPVTVDWSTDVAATPTEGSDMATADEDYESASGTLNFPAGETEMMIPVVLIDDELDEHREEFVVTLGNAVHGVLGTETATGAIEDDDEPPTISIADASGGESDGAVMFAVSLDAPSGLPVTVDWSTGVAATPSQGADMATAGEDYESASGTLNFPAGETGMTIRVVLIADELVEIREEFVVTLGNPMYAVLGTETATGGIEGDDEPTISIADASGGESDGPLMFAVSLDAPSVLPVTVDWSTDVAATPSQGSDMATADDDYESASGTLNFPAGETEMMIPVKLVNDELDEHREEFVVTLGNAVHGVLETETATGAIEDDDEPPTISIADASGGESDGPMMFAVSLDAPSGLPVTVDWSTDVAATPSQGSDMATVDEDYESASGTLNFPAGETEMMIPVELVSDELYEHREEFVVTLSNPMYAVLGTETATGAIEDDDEPPTISIADASGGESDGPLMFAVSLDAPSGLPVTFDWATAPDSAVAGEDFEAGSGSLTIPAGEMSGMVVVNVVADDVHEATETFTVMLSGAMYGTLADATATGTITDDDPPPTLAVADTTAAESAGRIDFTVTLMGATALPASVAWATSPGTADAGDDYTTSSGSLSFAPGETSMSFSVPVVSDALYEGSETFTVTLSGSTNSTLSVATATGTITDDDAEGVVKQWLSRFGRTVADHVVEALDARLHQAPGQTASQLTLGGLRVDVDRTVEAPFGETFSLRPHGSDLGQPVAPMHGPAFNSAFDAVWNDRARRPWDSQRVRNPGFGDVLSGSSFHYGAAAAGAAGDAWALWGRVATTSFSGDDGVLSHDGDVTTGTVGVDFERGDALFGVALSFSEGDGEFQGSSSGLAGGNLDSSVTLVNPYVRVMINACTSVWGLVGFGGGEMTLAAGDGGVPIDTDIEMTLGAAGFRGVLQYKLGNFDVATRGDAFLAQTSADAAPGLESVDADASRMRFALEATNVTELEGGGLFTPILEAGVRYDGGDAETGAGVEVGGGLRYADASGRVSLQVNARALLAHEDSDYQEWGLGASVMVRPDASGQGVTFNLRSTWGDIANGVDALWNGRDAGLAAAGLGTRYGARHDAEVGYGLNAPGGRNVLVPYIGVGASDIGTRDYRLGVRLRSNSTMNLSVEVDRREGFGPDPDHGVVLRGWLYW